jgi:hypothetical protein
MHAASHLWQQPSGPLAGLLGRPLRAWHDCMPYAAASHSSAASACLGSRGQDEPCRAAPRLTVLILFWNSCRPSGPCLTGMRWISPSKYTTMMGCTLLTSGLSSSGVRLVFQSMSVVLQNLQGAGSSG